MDPVISYELVHLLNEIEEGLEKIIQIARREGDYVAVFGLQCKLEQTHYIISLIKECYVRDSDDEYIEINEDNYKEYLRKDVEVSDDDFQTKKEMLLAGWNSRSDCYPIVATYGDGLIMAYKRARVRRENERMQGKANKKGEEMNNKSYEKGFLEGVKFATSRRPAHQDNAIMDTIEKLTEECEKTEDARRLSGTERKCRCDKAKVLRITDLGETEDLQEAYSIYDDSFYYKVGEIVKVDNFNPDRWNACSAGIHFFINKQEAIDF